MHKRIWIAVALAMAGGALPARAVVTSTTHLVSASCNGVNTAYPITFPYQKTSDIRARVYTGSTLTTTLALTTDYTVTLSSSPTSGTLTLVAGSRCANGKTLKIDRHLPLTQPTSLRTQGNFSPATHESMFDRALMQIQQIESEITDGTASATTVTTTEPIEGDGSSGAPVSCRTATGSVSGCLSSGDWTTFNNKAGLGANTFTGKQTVIIPSGDIDGVDSTAHGTGTGVKGTGGATSGVGVAGTGGAPNGQGVTGVGTGAGNGLTGTAGASGAGVKGIGGATSGTGVWGVASAGNSVGVVGTGQGTGKGVDGTGGATSGPGGAFTGGAPNGIGAQGNGAGSGAGVVANGGATGPGLTATAGGGNANGVTTTGAGTGSGITAVGGASGSAIAVKPQAASKTAMLDFYDESGNIVWTFGKSTFNTYFSLTDNGIWSGVSYPTEIFSENNGAVALGGATAQGSGLNAGSLALGGGFGGSWTPHGGNGGALTVSGGAGGTCSSGCDGNPVNGGNLTLAGGAGQDGGTDGTVSIKTVNTTRVLIDNLATTLSSTAATTRAGLRNSHTRNITHRSSVSVPDCTGATLNLTVTQFLDSGFATCGTAQTINFPTWQGAPGIVQGLPGTPAVGDVVEFTVVSTAAANVTVGGGTGGTISGNAVLNNTRATFHCRLTNVGAGTEGATCY